MHAAARQLAVDLPLQGQCEPPEDDAWHQRMFDAGIDTLGMHLEAVTPEVRQRIMPGKASVPLEKYFSSFEAAVKVFGRGQVSTRERPKLFFDEHGQMTHLLNGVSGASECRPGPTNAGLPSAFCVFYTPHGVQGPKPLCWGPSWRSLKKSSMRSWPTEKPRPPGRPVDF